VTAPQPTLDLHGFRVHAKAIADARSEARDAYLHHAELEANAKRDQRKTFGQVLARERSKGEPVAVAEALGRAAAADHEHHAALEGALAKAQLLLIDQKVDQLVNLRRDFDAGQRIDGSAA
jgi:hypothetical protein